MHAILPLVRAGDFPAIVRGKLDTVQVNLGYRCNQTCLHPVPRMKGTIQSYRPSH